MPTPEGLIKNAICEYLCFVKGCMFWINSSTGIYDPKKGIFRCNRSRFQKKGTADILGIYKGKPFAIEVKTKSGKLSVDQRRFLKEFESFGGIAIVARSVDDVIKELKNVDQRE